MRSGQLNCRAALLAFGLALIPIARAHAREPLHVLWVEAAQPELSARIEGQTRDLGLTLERVNEPAIDPARAAALAQQHDASAVLWVEAQADGGMLVRVYDAERKSERSREVPKQPANEQLGDSAVFEATALVVRGELQQLIEREAEAARLAGASGETTGTPATSTSGTPTGGQDGKTAAANAGTTAPGDDDEDEDDADPIADEGSDAPGGARHRAWSLHAGMRLARVSADHLALGPLLGLGLDVRWLALGLEATTAFPIEVQSDQLTVELRRHGASARALARLFESRRLILALGLDAGVVLYARSTEVRAGTLRATPDSTTVSAALGPRGELQWLPTEAFGAALLVGLDLLTAPTHFATSAQGARTPLQRLSFFEPWAAVCLVFRFGAEASR